MGECDSLRGKCDYLRGKLVEVSYLAGKAFSSIPKILMEKQGPPHLGSRTTR